jgi:hypothetical protein
MNIRNGAGEQITVGYDWDHDGQVYVNRGQTHLLQLAGRAFYETRSWSGFARDFRVRKSKM